MARRGPDPKDDSGEWEYILDAPNRKKPLVELPKQRGTDEDGTVIPWHPQTLAWWETMRRLAHTTEWAAAEWHALVGLAYVADTFYVTGQASAHAEWRRGSDALGLTAEARRKLRIKLLPMEQLAQLAPHKVPAPAPTTTRKTRATTPEAPAPTRRADRRARSAARA